MFNLYLYRGDVNEITGGAQELSKACVQKWAKTCGIDLECSQIEIFKDGNGKPLVNLNSPTGGKDFGQIHISISHTGKLWGILIGDKPCGLDLQYEVECDYEKIADRFFKPMEAHYIKAGKCSNQMERDRFFQLWTVREAYGKMIGKGFFGDFPLFANSYKTYFQGAGYQILTPQIVTQKNEPKLYCAIAIQE